MASGLIKSWKQTFLYLQLNLLILDSSVEIVYVLCIIVVSRMPYSHIINFDRILFLFMFINFYDLKFFVAGNLISKRSASIQMDGADEKESSSIGHFQCVHCATPRGVLKKDNMQTAMDQLFEIRGSHFPYTVIHPNCSNPKNIESSIPYRETCKFPFCYQITFNDKEGKPLMIRGCAETFMATGNLKRSTSDFHCRRIHETLDIRECYCRNSPACFSWASLVIINRVRFYQSLAFFTILTLVLR